jgi:cellulose synthase operon protein YhjQ
MTERNPLSDPNETPEDVATLYSWANLHGAKYRDFSAARAQTRESARLRVEQVMDEERRLRGEAEELQALHQAEMAEAHAPGKVEETEPVAETKTAQQILDEVAEQDARIEAAIEAEEVEQQAARQAEQQALDEAAAEAARSEAEQGARHAAETAVQQAAQREREIAARLMEHQAAQRAANQAAQQRAAQPPSAQAQALSSSYFPPEDDEPISHTRPQAFRPALAEIVNQSQYARAENASSRDVWTTADSREPAGRPAWLSDQSEVSDPALYQPPAPPQPSYASPTSLPQAPEDTLQGSRDRLTSRWFALRGVFEGAPPPVEQQAPAPVIARAPSMAVFSLAGGVGKTSLVATLGRALSARGERVLLVDTAAFGLLPFFFGATDQRPGLLRTFSPPGVSNDTPIQMVTLEPESMPIETSSTESLSGEILKFARGASRIIVDLATASGATTRRIMRMAPMVLVPVIPDMNSVVSVSSIDAFFEHNSNVGGKPALPFYVMNQFDASLPLHLDVREVLREQLGDRLLPFALRRTPAMSEALAEGMTVMDYAPGSSLAEDFSTLAGWVKGLSAPATTTYRGVRWSER